MKGAAGPRAQDAGPHEERTYRCSSRGSPRWKRSRTKRSKAGWLSLRNIARSAHRWGTRYSVAGGSLHREIRR